MTTAADCSASLTCEPHDCALHRLTRYLSFAGLRATATRPERDLASSVEAALLTVSPLQQYVSLWDTEGAGERLQAAFESGGNEVCNWTSEHSGAADMYENRPACKPATQAVHVVADCYRNQTWSEETQRAAACAIRVTDDVCCMCRTLRKRLPLWPSARRPSCSSTILPASHSPA